METNMLRVLAIIAGTLKSQSADLSEHIVLDALESAIDNLVEGAEREAESWRENALYGFERAIAQIRRVHVVADEVRP